MPCGATAGTRPVGDQADTGVVRVMKSSDSLRLLRELLLHRNKDWRQHNPDRDGCVLVTFVNPLTVHVLNQAPGYAEVLGKFDLIQPDGGLLARHATRVLGFPVARRSFDGNSLAPEVFAHCVTNGLCVGFIGGVDGVASAASGRIQDAFGMDVKYTRSGFFSAAAEVSTCYDEIISNGVDVVVCGMGAPYQDRFLVGLKEAGWRGLGFTCGGYLDQVVDSGIEYYPALVNRLNLRAPYRLIREPRRLWRRYLLEYLPFMWADLAGRLSRTQR